jgi:pilus assembly protein CpaE
MAAPPSPEQAETVRAEVVRVTCQLAPEAFDYIVMDTSSTFSESTLIALESSKDIVVPMTPDIAALRTTMNAMRILKAVKIDPDKVRVVLNEIVPRAGLSKQQVVTSLGKTPFTIPHAGSLFIDALNHGMPVVTLEQQPPVAKALLELAKEMCEPEEETVEPAKARSGLFGLTARKQRA